jgi:transcriptional regulator with XRE-family HTH domain
VRESVPTNVDKVRRQLLGDALREARGSHGLTPKQLAAAVKTSRRSVSAWETGARPVVGKVVARVSDELRLPGLPLAVRLLGALEGYPYQRGQQPGDPCANLLRLARLLRGLTVAAAVQTTFRRMDTATWERHEAGQIVPRNKFIAHQFEIPGLPQDFWGWWSESATRPGRLIAVPALVIHRCEIELDSLLASDLHKTPQFRPDNAGKSLLEASLRDAGIVVTAYQTEA